MKKLLSLLLTFVMVISIFAAVPSSAAEKDCSVTSTQSKSGNFNSNYTITGTGAIDMVNIAMAQNERTQPQIGYTENWCADFVSDCAKLAGQGSAVPFNGAVNSMYNAVISAGGKRVSTAQAGDLVFFYASSESKLGHVGIALDSSRNISGNIFYMGASPSKVCILKNSSEGYSHWFYVRPNYKNNTHIHSYNTFAYYEAAHPHYKCYKCSCGAIQVNTSQPTNIANCEKCLPNAPVLNVRAGTSAEYTQFCWNATTNTDAYEIYVHDADTNEIVFYYYSIPTLEYQIKIPAGKYKACAVSVNSKLYGSSKWWTSGEFVNFTVEEGDFAPQSSISYNGNKYEIYDIAMPWYDAKAKCEELGGHLVTITSSEESNAIKTLLEYGVRSYYWMGITNETDNNEWINITGEEFSFCNWASAEPSNTNGVEHFGSIVNSEYATWNDAENMHAYRSIGFICEYENVEPERPLGDVDGDNDISIMDATLIQRHSAKQITLTDEQQKYADTDKDGKTSVMDATAIQRFIAKITTEF